MSQENVEVARAAYSDPRGLTGDSERISSDAVFDFSALYPDVPVLQGLDAIREFRRTAPWADIAFEPERFLHVDDERVLVLVRATAEGQASGVSLAQLLAHELTFRDGRLVRFKVYPNHSEALEAVGLSASAMSGENVKLVRDGFAALARGDFEPLLASLDEDVDWVNPPYAVEPGTRRGIGGFRRALSRMGASFGDIRVQVDEVIDAGDNVIVTGHWTGEGTGSGIPLETAFSSVLTLRNGKIVRYAWFRDKAEALEAVGLSE